MLFGVFMVMGIDFTNFKIAEPGNIFFLLSALFVSINAFVIKSVQLDKKNPICDDVVAFYNNFITMIFFTAASLIAGTVKEVQNIFTDKYVALALLFAAAGQTLVYVVIIITLEIILYAGKSFPFVYAHRFNDHYLRSFRRTHGGKTVYRNGCCNSWSIGNPHAAKSHASR